MSETQTTSAAPDSWDAAGVLVSTAEIDASCRWPVVFLLTKAAFWLLLSGLFWLVTSIQLFHPDFWSVCPWITVGRMHPAAWNLFLYGFAVPSGLGVTLWLLARLGNAPLQNGGMVLIGGAVWNVGVLLGLYGILRGDNTGFSWFEFPGYATPLLFVSYLVIAIVAVLNFTRRRRSGLYVSQWFLLAALFWFPWIFSTAAALLDFRPVRGVAQVVVDGWYKAGFGGVWLGGIGVAVVYYLLPKLLDRPLHSRSLASLGFWSMLFFSGWNVVAPDAPVPAWITSASTAGALLTLIPTIAFTINVLRTARGGVSPGFPRPELLFTLFASVCYIVMSLAAVWAAKRGADAVVRFTLFGEARQIGLLYGFGAMSLFAAVYFIVPRLLPTSGCFLKTASLHFWTSAAGIVLLVFVYAFGGIVQGDSLNNPQLSLVDISGTIRSCFAAGILGVLLILAGQALLLFQLCSAACRAARVWLVEWYADVARGAAKPAEAKG
jgi:cytochrome c oxidase cbb3-type subunit 1